LLGASERFLVTAGRIDVEAALAKGPCQAFPEGHTVIDQKHAGAHHLRWTGRQGPLPDGADVSGHRLTSLLDSDR
jgi:hypothetical protein